LEEQEAVVMELKRRQEDVTDAQAELERMREHQRPQQDRQRLLSLLQR
jgi:hypothetical protein